jgi:hypothetical protein
MMTIPLAPALLRLGAGERSDTAVLPVLEIPARLCTGKYGTFATRGSLSGGGITSESLIIENMISTDQVFFTSREEK